MTTNTDNGVLPGISSVSVSAWLEERLPESRPPFEFAQITGGRSNLTFLVSDAIAQRWVVRRPPLAGVLPSAHDVEREYSFLCALENTDVPVPKPRAFCSEESVNGGPFYVMEFVPGHVLHTRSSAVQLKKDKRRHVGEGLARALAQLHAVDPVGIGLGHFGRPKGYIDRQIRRWLQQWQSSGAPRAAATRAVERIGRRLATYIPSGHETTLVHGDFQLGNVIISQRGAVAAILDWEMATRGDPLADLGLLLAHWSGPGDLPDPLNAAPSGLDGFHSRQEVAELYREASGRDITAIDYYIGFAYWKIAIILQGIHSRASAGAYGPTSAEDEHLPDLVDKFLELAERTPLH